MCRIESKLLWCIQKKLIKPNNILKCIFESKTKLGDRKSNIDFIKEKIYWGNSEYKFLEKTVWDENKDFFVALGFNPTNNEIDNIDTTNRKIIEKTEKEFGGYYLLNLYPQRSDSKSTFGKSDVIGEKYYELIPDLLDIILKNTNLKLLIFFGRTVAIDENILDKLKLFKNENRLKMTVKEGTNLFYHPSRVKIEIKDVQKDLYKAMFHVVGCENK